MKSRVFRLLTNDLSPVMVVGIFASTFQWIVLFGSICSASALTRSQETLGIFLDTKNLDQRSIPFGKVNAEQMILDSRLQNTPQIHMKCANQFMQKHTKQPPGKPCK